MISIDNMEDDILNELFITRKDKLQELEEKEKQREIFINDKQCSENLQIALYNLPDCFEEVSRMINKAVDEKIQAQNEILSYFCEKFYKIGFRDGISLIFGCLKQDHEK